MGFEAANAATRATKYATHCSSRRLMGAAKGGKRRRWFVWAGRHQPAPHIVVVAPATDGPPPAHQGGSASKHAACPRLPLNASGDTFCSSHSTMQVPDIQRPTVACGCSIIDLCSRIACHFGQLARASATHQHVAPIFVRTEFTFCPPLVCPSSPE